MPRDEVRWATLDGLAFGFAHGRILLRGRRDRYAQRGATTESPESTRSAPIGQLRMRQGCSLTLRSRTHPP